MSELALRMVQQLHQPRVYSCDSAPSGYRVCAECRQGWPCQTNQIIETTLNLPPPSPPPEAPVGPTPRAPQPKKKR